MSPSTHPGLRRQTRARLPLVAVHIVTFNSREVIAPCLCSVLAQEGFSVGENLLLLITDNASSDGTANVIRTHFDPQRMELHESEVNMGFAAGQNAGISRALKRGAEFILVLNPDVRLEPQCLARLVHALAHDPRAGMCCPKLRRADSSLNPIEPFLIDAAGIFITPSIRHFDRGSEELDQGQFDAPAYVFGASGAAVLLSRAFVLDASLPAELALWQAEPHSPHVELFDSAFFAYREDADLAWRSQWLGWKCRYEPAAIAYHKRLVTPQRRDALLPQINCLGVQNRFLLQLNNLALLANLYCLPWMLMRNMLVFSAACTVERTSLPAFAKLLRLLPRTFKIRAWLRKKRRASALSLSRWFDFQPRTEPVLIANKEPEPIRSALVIIVNYNSGARVVEALHHLTKQQDTPLDGFELKIIVVDNASSDGSALGAQSEFGKHPGLSFLLLQQNLGFAGAVNRAAAQDSADALVILNPDVRIHSSDIAQLCRCLERFPAIGAVSPRLENLDARPQAGYFRRFPTLASTLCELFYVHRIWPANPWTSHYKYSDDAFIQAVVGAEQIQAGRGQAEPLLLDQPAAACLVVRRSAFDKVNGFDSSFWPAWFEDVDFCRRLFSSANYCAICPSVTAAHEGGYSLSRLSSANFAACWYPNLLRYWEKHGSFAEFLLLRLAFTAALLLRSAVALGSACTLSAREKRGKGVELSKRLLRLALFGGSSNWQRRVLGREEEISL